MCPHEIRPSVSPGTAADIPGQGPVRDGIPSSEGVNAPPAVEPSVTDPAGTKAVDADDSFPVAEFSV